MNNYKPRNKTDIFFYLLPVLFFIAAGYSFFLPAVNNQSENNVQPRPSRHLVTITQAASPTMQTVVSQQRYTDVVLSPTLQPTSPSLQVQATQKKDETVAIQNTQSPTAPPAMRNVQLSVNGSAAFSVAVAQDSDQCGVLTKALSDGKLSSLDMRYDDNLKTYAVYQINGIGKKTGVWWVYTINGQSPNQGCSYIKAQEGDSIHWNYIGA